MANAFFKKKIGPEAVPVLAWSSNLPDIDAIVMLSSNPAAITFRRTFGHSVFLFPIWAAGLAWLFRKKYPKQSYAALFGLCLLGASVHVFFDLINSFGVVLLWPFSSWRPEFAAVFIVDLVLLGLLALGARERWARLSVGAAAVYLAVCFTGRALAAESLSSRTASDPPEFAYVFPEPLGPHRWRGVTRKGGFYRLYLMRSFYGRDETKEALATAPEDPRVLKVRQTPLGKRLDAFFKAPVWTVSPEPEGGATVTGRDLRFTSLVISRKAGFEYRFHVSPSGEVEPFTKR